MYIWSGYKIWHCCSRDSNWNDLHKEFVKIERVNGAFSTTRIGYDVKEPPSLHNPNGVAIATNGKVWVAVPVCLENDDIPGFVHWKLIRRAIKWGKNEYVASIDLSEMDRVSFLDGSSYDRYDNFNPVDIGVSWINIFSFLPMFRENWRREVLQIDADLLYKVNKSLGQPGKISGDSMLSISGVSNERGNFILVEPLMKNRSASIIKVPFGIIDDCYYV